MYNISYYLGCSETVAQPPAFCLHHCCSMVVHCEIFACSGCTQLQTVPSLHDLAQSRNCSNTHISITEYTQLINLIFPPQMKKCLLLCTDYNDLQSISKTHMPHHLITILTQSCNIYPLPSLNATNDKNWCQIVEFSPLKNYGKIYVKMFVLNISALNHSWTLCIMLIGCLENWTIIIIIDA